MRRSKKELILTAALEVLESCGVEGLTFEAVAEQAQITRGGVVYHFATREELINAIGAHLVDSWRTELHEALGKAVEESAVSERVVALVRSGLEGRIRPGELVFLLNAGPAATRAHQEWELLCTQWVGERSALSVQQRVALLAADGYWTHLASGGAEPDPADPETVEMLVRMAGQA